MKHIFSIIVLLGLFVQVNGQIKVNGNYQVINNVHSLDNIFLFENIENSSLDESSEIHFIATSKNDLTRWFTYKNGERKRINFVNSLSDKETYIEPQHNTGYIVESGGKTYQFWVVDRSQLAVNEDIIYFETLEGNLKSLSIAASLNKTELKNSIRSELNLVLEEDDDKPDPIVCKITTKTKTRDALNENQRPAEGNVDGSAPLDIEFFSNPEGEVREFLWQIFKEGELLETSSEENTNYLFERSGKYRVTLQVRGEEQSASDSINIDVSESQIMAPNVFTPNGDGVNDEFRVAYTSIAEFQATIINRWGRTIFSWNDPQKGWDGTISGKPAAEGTYFYIIRARGADDKDYLLKGHINLLR